MTKEREYVFTETWAHRLRTLWRWRQNVHITGPHVTSRNSEQGLAVCINPPPATTPTATEYPVLWVRLGDEHPTSHGHYKWTRVVPDFSSDPQGWVDDPNTLDSGELYNAHATSNTPGLSGRVVQLTDLGVEAGGLFDGEVRYEFVSSDQIIAVNVEKVGGSDGTQTTPASWTYDVWTLTGHKIASAVGLVRPRPNGRMAFQSGDEGVGLYILGVGLWDAGEVPATGSCA